MHLTHKQITEEVCGTFASAFVKVLFAAETDPKSPLQLDSSLILAVALVKAEVVPISAVEEYLFNQGLDRPAVKHFTNMVETLLNKCESLIPEPFHDTL